MTEPHLLFNYRKACAYLKSAAHTHPATAAATMATMTGVGLFFSGATLWTHSRLLFVLAGSVTFSSLAACSLTYAYKHDYYQRALRLIDSLCPLKDTRDTPKSGSDTKKRQRTHRSSYAKYTDRMRFRAILRGKPSRYYLFP